MRAALTIALSAYALWQSTLLAAPASDASTPAQPYLLDLATVLRLANAQNLDIQVARERLAEAKALHSGALAQFLPWLAPGITYRRHDHLIQDVSGNFFQVHKDSYAPGATLAAQVDLGDAVYRSLATKQQVNAALHASETQRQASTYTAVQNYFDLLLAQAAVGVAKEAVAISTDYDAQVKQAVEAGLLFKGDALRVQVERENNELLLRRSTEQQRAAGTQLAQTLHLDPALELGAQESELVPLSLVDTNASLLALLAQAHATRPEPRRDQAAIAAARETRKGAVYGPLIPSAGAQFFAGGLGGSSDAGPSRFGNQEELFVGLSWKVGPGGLFDFSRRRAAESQLRSTELFAAKTRDEISREVVDAFTRVQSLNDQIHSAQRSLEAAQEGLRLAKLRREFAIGIVLENIQAEQDLTRARYQYLQTIAELNKAQYTLTRALGKL